MIENGFVKLDRRITRWRWYHDPNTFRMFVHLILIANYEDCDFQKITIHRGQLVTSLASLSRDLGISIRSVRTSLEHLESTGEVTSKNYSKFRVITIQNYDTYQTNRQAKRQTTDKQATSSRQATDNNGRRYKKAKKEEEFFSEKKPFVPPTPDDVMRAAAEAGLLFTQADAERFVAYNASRSWEGISEWEPLLKVWKTQPASTPQEETDEWGKPIGGRFK